MQLLPRDVGTKSQPERVPEREHSPRAGVEPGLGAGGTGQEASSHSTSWHRRARGGGTRDPQHPRPYSAGTRPSIRVANTEAASSHVSFYLPGNRKGALRAEQAQKTHRRVRLGQPSRDFAGHFRRSRRASCGADDKGHKSGLQIKDVLCGSKKKVASHIPI